jgi:hypothetical protein
MKIVSAKISPMPISIMDPLPQVTITLANGTETFLFEYFPDEISFTPEDFVGKTVDEAWELKRQRDIAYFQS